MTAWSLTRLLETLDTTALAVLCLVLLPTFTSAQPDFSNSAIHVDPTSLTEGAVVTMLVTLRNSGDEDAPYAEMVFGLPLEALFVDRTGLEEGTLDLEEKTLTAMVNLPAASERQFRVRMVIPRDAGGNALAPDLVLRYPYRQVTFRGGEPIAIDTAPSTRGVPLGGGIRIAPAGLVVVATAGLYPLLWMTLPRRRRQHGPILMIVLAMGFLAMFGTLAKQDWETVTSWPSTQCTILDKRVRVDTYASRVGGQRTRRSETQDLNPLLAVSYTADGREIISTGYDTGTRLSIGRSEALAAEYAAWEIGNTVPCWFNPRAPDDVIVVRGFGGAYAFALLPLGVLVLGILGVRRGGR